MYSYTVKKKRVTLLSKTWHDTCSVSGSPTGNPYTLLGAKTETQKTCSSPIGPIEQTHAPYV